jgi:hypothetical protein
MLEKSKISNPYRLDITLFLILIPFISAINYYLTYSHIRLNYFLVITFVIDTLEGYTAWWTVRYFILWLDRKLPYEKDFAIRIVVQLLGSLTIGLTIISLLTEMVSWIAKGKPAPLSFYTIDLFIIGIWFFFINGVYIGLYYYHLWKKSEAQRIEEKQLKENGLLVRNGKQELKLEFDELSGFSVTEEYVVANQILGKKYYLDQSLDKIERILPISTFFRVNRKFILHRQTISGFKRAEGGKIIVLLNPNESFPQEIAVSRLKAPAFKAWFRPGT